LNFAKVMVAMVTNKLVLSVCTYGYHNTLHLLKISAVEPLVSNIQQFKKCPLFRHGVYIKIRHLQFAVIFALKNYV